jgi:hypothetical protein
MPALAPPKPPHPTLPLAAGLGAVGVLVVSLFASKLLLDAVVDYQWPIVVYVALLGVVGYGPSVGWWLYAVRRWSDDRRSARDVLARGECRRDR